MIGYEGCNSKTRLCKPLIQYYFVIFFYSYTVSTLQMFLGELFHDVQSFVQSALDGYNISIFAYGQSRSGKTHTLVLIYSNVYIIIFHELTHCSLRIVEVTLRSCVSPNSV